MFESLFTVEALVALATLTALEIVLGIDNIIFIAILVGRLPAHQRDKGRNFGLGLAMLTRIMLLLSLFWIMKLTTPLFTIFSHDISGRDLILILGGLFLLAKSTTEIHNDIENDGEEEKELKQGSAKGFFNILIQIAIHNIVFSLVCVITGVGMVDNILIMILGVMIAVGVMMFASKSISNFIEANPTIKILALSFLILVGVTLIAEGLGLHISKAYVYFAMAFSLAVESVNIYTRKKKAKRGHKEV